MNKSYVVDQQKGKHAILHYKVLNKLTNFLSFLEIQTKTGRHHQIRVQLSNIDV